MRPRVFARGRRALDAEVGTVFPLIEVDCILDPLVDGSLSSRGSHGAHFAYVPSLRRHRDPAALTVPQRVFFDDALLVCLQV
eukprot:2653281-Rhodomonas_salina.4